MTEKQKKKSIVLHRVVDPTITTTRNRCKKDGHRRSNTDEQHDTQNTEDDMTKRLARYLRYDTRRTRDDAHKNQRS